MPRTSSQKSRACAGGVLKTVESDVPVAKPGIGAMHLPNGKAYYAYLARFYTTTALTPDEIHDIGIQEVARIRAEMERKKRRPDSMALWRNSQIPAHRCPLLRHLARIADGKSAYIAKRADDQLPRLCDPAAIAYGVREVPRNIEENTTGRYNPVSRRWVWRAA